MMEEGVRVGERERRKPGERERENKKKREISLRTGKNPGGEATTTTKMVNKTTPRKKNKKKCFVFGRKKYI